MGPEVAAFRDVAIIVVALAAALSVVVVALVRGVQSRPKHTKVTGDQNLQLEHLQQSVDAIAVEVERIAEAQRFSAKLLAERNEPASVKRSGSS